MPRFTWMVFVVVLLIAADAPKNDAAKKDLEQLQGTWQLVSGEDNGKPFSDEKVGELRLVIKGNGYSVPVSDVGLSKKGTFKIDPTKMLKQLDFTPTEDPNKGKTFPGIYQLVGNVLTACYAEPGKERPKEFSAKAGSGYRLRIWRREKK